MPRCQVNIFEESNEYKKEKKYQCRSEIDENKPANVFVLHAEAVIVLPNQFTL